MPQSPKVFNIFCISTIVTLIMILYFFMIYMDFTPIVSITPIVGFGKNFYPKLMKDGDQLTSTINATTLSITSNEPKDELLKTDNTNFETSTSNPTTTSTGLKGCPLPQVDPYDPGINSYVDWRYAETFRNCSKDFKVRSKYKNRLLEVEINDDKCSARCFQQISYHHRNTADSWTKITSTKSSFDCEFIEVKCVKKHNGVFPKEEVTYAMLHSDFKPLKTKPIYKRKYKGKRYDVYIFVLDSVGNSAAERTLQKTISYMEKSFKAVKFPYVNKVGVNSRPNALAWFLGKQIEPIDRLGLGRPSIKEDWDWEESCGRYMDNESSIFQEFRNEGYRTLLTDDFFIGVLNYPNCKGWNKPVVDHTMDTLIEQSYSDMQKNNYYGSNCQFLHREDLKYLKEFMLAYPDEPHFTLTWMTEVVHDASEGGMVMDTDFLVFFIENRERFENAFVMMMSDHGNRMSKIILSEIGTLDKNNPMLMISLPKELRTKENLGILKENAEKLQTHYDTRATILDILRYQPAVNFTDREPMKIENEHGNSYFRRQEGERSCMTLPIPFSYCICQYKTEKIDPKSEVSIAAGNAIVDSVNKILTEAGLTNKCELWKFSYVESNNAYAPVDQTGAMNIIVATSYPYKSGRLTALVHRSADGSFSVGKVDRADKYGDRGKCAKGQYEALCDCKH